MKEMAERTGVAVLLVRHMNKQEARKSLYRGGGSIGIVGAARVAMVVEKHPENEDLYVLAIWGLVIIRSSSLRIREPSILPISMHVSNHGVTVF